MWQEVPAFASLAALNDWLEQRCIALWREVKHPEQKERTIAEVWADEQPHLMPLPPPFDGFIEHTKPRVTDLLIAFERDRYSVPSPFANRPVSLRVYAERLVMVAEGEVIAEHARLMAQGHDRPGRTVYDWRHYLAVVQTQARCTAQRGNRLPSCRQPLNACSRSCSNVRAVTARWPRSWRWCCIMTSKRYGRG